MKHRLLITLVVLVGWLPLHAQDLTFSQFYELPLLRNPSLAGVFKGDLRVTAVHRSQWQSVTVPFQTSAVGVEYKLPVFNFNDYVTLGLQASHDIAGDIRLKRTQLFPVLNYHKSLSDDVDNYISLAFMGGPVQSQFDPTQAKLDDQFVNGAYAPTNSTTQVFSRTGFSYWDASTGLTFSSGFGYESRFYVGAALFHLNRPKVNFYNETSETHVDHKWAVNAGLSTAVSDNNRMLFFADMFKQGGNRQFLGGVLYETDLVQYDEDDNVSFAVGGFYRWNDAFVPTIRVTMHEWQAGLSYDVNVSKLKTASQMRGGFELTASYRGFLNTRSSTQDKMRCVMF
ncbi:PorP/SprF family type IX secretion system membrane protein [Aridibaculum aurantiacum]|uniref:PorP/SprF family type IX secretion system membrane protein n=1 Tax=Aridibaculum aurantiacum TaxID=2810307 RepID=UPI001A96E88C|nr:PorP/SprF family type IX secretion system membrane protein [Aridibaculum aurantiacum]